MQSNSLSIQGKYNYFNKHLNEALENYFFITTDDIKDIILSFHMCVLN